MNNPPPNLTQRVAGAAAWNTLLFPVQLLVGLAASVLLLYVLTPAQYGVLTLLSGLAATIGLLADVGIERSLPRFIPEVEQQGGRRGVARFLIRIVALKLAIIAVCLALLLLASDTLIGFVVSREQDALRQSQATLAQLQAAGAPAAELASAQARSTAQAAVIGQVQTQGQLFLWAVGGLVLFGALYDVCMQFLTAYFKQKAWNLITAVVALLQPLLVSGFVLAGWGLNGVLLGMLITPVVAVALALWQTLRAAHDLGPGAASSTPDTSLPRRFAAFAGVSFATQGTTWFYDTAFISFALTAIGVSLDQMALLAFAYTTIAKGYLSYAYLPFGGLLTPLLSRVRARNEPAALAEAYASLSRLFALILIPAGVGLAVLTPWLLALLYPRYNNELTIMLCYLLIGFCFGESLLSVPHNLLMVDGRFRMVLLARLLALLSLPLLALLVPPYGLIGAALAVGVARMLPRLATLAYTRRALGLHYPLAFVLRVLAATLAFALPLVLLLPRWPFPPAASGFSGKLSAALSLGVLVALAVALYLLALRLLGGLDPQERQRILSLKLPFKKALAKIL